MVDDTMVAVICTLWSNIHPMTMKIHGRYILYVEKCHSFVKTVMSPGMGWKQTLLWRGSKTGNLMFAAIYES